MTAYRFVTLTCDACGEISDSGESRNVHEARQHAKAERWRVLLRKDLCPRHFGYYYSDVSGWIYNPGIASDYAARSGYAYYPERAKQ